VGGGANVDQVTHAFKILLQDAKASVVLVNIFGGIMKCTTIAEGVLAAVRKTRLRVPLVVRLEGTEVKEGREILQRSGLRFTAADTLWEAAQKAVAAARERV
ncbi:MAG: succinate--CoA ligase subunit beta, partial [Elusimicrobia bacterium]|nr:succinate--CoA ligase subunit beta [Elusimicrobiota bacterium]